MKSVLVSILLSKLILSQPDLSLDEARMRASKYIAQETYQADSCEINECLMHLKGGSFPATRSLLRFDTRAANIGNQPFRLGVPSPGNPNFVWDACHSHYHFENFAEYKVYSEADFNANDFRNNRVPETGKRAFCLMDSAQTSLYTGPSSIQPRRQQFSCSNQGISVGWQDIYGANLDCQFVDVTDLAPGNYVLVVTLNPTFSLNEHDITNNEATIPFEITEQGGRQIPATCRVGRPDWLGDGYCDSAGGYNTEACGYDMGDCCTDTCHDGTFMCGVNGYNCVDPNGDVDMTGMEIPPSRATTTSPTKAPVSMGPACAVEHEGWLGDGYCDFGQYNTAGCMYDMGDCCQQSCVGSFYTCGQNGYGCINPAYTS